MQKSIKSVHDLKVYRLAYKFAMEIFKITHTFPKNETYSLVDQLRRVSRSVSINIREGFAKKRHENIFIRHLTDSLGSSEETRGWLSFAKDCGYINIRQFKELDSSYDKLDAMRYVLIKKWKNFA